MSKPNKPKLCFIDVETTGLNANRNGIWQVAAIITSPDGHTVLDTLKLEFNPGKTIEITEEALGVIGKSREALRALPMSSEEAYKLFVEFLCKHVNKYDKMDKLQFIAYNAPFDDKFVRSWASRNGEKYFGSYFWYPSICVMQMVAAFVMPIRPVVQSFKLETICAMAEIEWNDDEAHDALYDIQKTRELFLKIAKM